MLLQNWFFPNFKFRCNHIKQRDIHWSLQEFIPYFVIPVMWGGFIGLLALRLVQTGINFSLFMFNFNADTVGESIVYSGLCSGFLDVF